MQNSGRFSVNRPAFCIRSGWWLGPDKRSMLTEVRVFGFVRPLRYVEQSGEHAAHTLRRAP